MTREAEQARAALEADAWDERTMPLFEEQEDIVYRTDEVIEAIEALPDGFKQFKKEIDIVTAARSAMREALALLEDGETGPETVAAETEAIELLLRSRRSGGGGGGGGGSSSGGGGGGTDGVSALALAGRSTGAGETYEEREVAMGQEAEVSKVPAEFQSALDRYFEALEGR